LSLTVVWHSLKKEILALICIGINT
jgi:hypothetical protein